MKSFIFALLMLISVTIFVTVNAHQTACHIDEMLAITEILPITKEAFENRSPETEMNVLKLTELWERNFPLISFTAGYENTNRCDEAIGSLFMYFQNGNGSDFTVALAEFRDSLKRLRILEGIHWQGIL